MQDPKEAVSGDSIAPKKIILRSSEGKFFEVDESLAKQSRTIANAISYSSDGFALPVFNVTGPILEKIIEYWEKHAAPEDEEEVKKFDEKFMGRFERDELFQMINAANYLECAPLIDLTCQTLANIIKDMTVEEVRAYIGVVNDWTPEEEAAVRKENEWAHKK